jgi:serralysin
LAAIPSAACDRDWFRISLQTGRSCRFHLNGIDLADPTLALRDGSGSQIAFNDDFNGRNPQISFTATANGTYFLDAGSYGSGTGRHSLEATQIEEASNDYSADVLARGNVSIGREASGSIDFADDRDWFRVSLATGRTHTLTLIGNRLPDPRLSLISTDERTILATNDDFGES